MKIGLMMPNYARWFRDDAIWDVCLKAKELGFDALSFVDHVIITRAQYAGMGNGYMEQYMAMCYVAAVTNAQGWKPILTQAINVIPYRPPVLQAKMVATLDSLSGGRLMIGAGSGYQEFEFKSLGLDITKRGEMTREYVECMRELWKNQVASFHGKYSDFTDMTISVRPTTQPYPPIIYGSHGPGPRRDIAKMYQGNIEGFNTKDPESVAKYQANIDDLERRWKENGRSGRPFQMCMNRAHLTTSREEAGQVVTKGVTPRGVDRPTSQPERLAEGEERVYMSDYHLTLVDDYVDQLRHQEALGMDMALIWLPSYNFRGLNNLQLQLQQMELVAEHVLPKLSKDTTPIEMDFEGTLHRPFGDDIHGMDGPMRSAASTARA
ncbi:MAG: LLM class flavin-dependent oxidoreductase [Dehalococcoidia bacterium]